MPSNSFTYDWSASTDATLADIERLEAAGRFDEAFARMAARNRTDRQNLIYGGVDPDALSDQVALQFKAIEAAFQADTFDRFASGNGSAAPIFVVGMPRSGSTLVEQILATHPRVIGLSEPAHLWHVLNGRADWLVPGSVPADYFRRLAAELLKAMGDLGWERRASSSTSCWRTTASSARSA